MISQEQIFVLKPKEKVTLLFKFLTYRSISLDMKEFNKENKFNEDSES